MSSEANTSTISLKDNFAKIKGVKNSLIFTTGAVNGADITVVIPVFGYKKYLAETLLSIKNQASSKLKAQILIVDNKVNVDNSKDIISCIKKSGLENVSYFLSNKELTPNSNFNNAILLSKTDYVCMVHDDDLLAKDFFLKVEAILPYLKRNKKVGLVHGLFKIFHKKEDIHQANKPDRKATIRRIFKFEISHAGCTKCGIPSCGFLINKRAFIDSGGFDDEFPSSGDAFLAAIMINIGYKLLQWESLTGYYRISNNTSLKLNICQGFIKEDYYFGEDWSKAGGAFRKNTMALFRNYRYSQNIESKVRVFRELNPEITISNLDFRKTYKKYHEFGFCRIVRAILKLFVSTAAFFSRKSFKIRRIDL